MKKVMMEVQVYECSKIVGGLRTEFFNITLKELFSPELGLFKVSANERSLEANPMSIIVPNHLKLYEFAGLLLGKVLEENLFLKF